MIHSDLDLDRKSWLASKVARAFTFEEYLEDVKRQAREGRSSGPNQSPQYIEYTKLSAQRMTRWLKSLNPEDFNFDFEIDRPLTFLTLTESWCGDAAHISPVLYLLALQNTITLKFIYRDEHPDLMSEYLTNGSRSIPKVIVLDDNFNECAAWGPRPAPAQELYQKLKSKGDIQIMVQALQKWYNQDKGITTKIEIQSIIRSLG